MRWREGEWKNKMSGEKEQMTTKETNIVTFKYGNNLIWKNLRIKTASGKTKL